MFSQVYALEHSICVMYIKQVLHMCTCQKTCVNVYTYTLHICLLYTCLSVSTCSGVYKHSDTTCTEYHFFYTLYFVRRVSDCVLNMCKHDTYMYTPKHV